MQQVVTVNDDFHHLNDGVPPYIARFIVAGEYDRALRLIEEELETGNRPEMEPCLRAEYARLLRTRRDFCLTRADVIGQIRTEWPEFGDAELDTLIDRERLDWRYVDGEQRFLQSCVESLRLYPNDVPGLACPPTNRADQLAVLDEMRSKGYAERRVRVRHTLGVGKDVDVDPETHVMAWIPYPSGQQVADIKFVEASEGAQIAPATAPQRTVHWDVQGERSFFVEYEYTIRAPYVDLWADNPIAPVWGAPFAPAPAPAPEDLAAEEPHLVFTPYLRSVAGRLYADIPAEDMLERARAAYLWVTQNVDYRYQPAYVLLDSIADSCARSRRADCGVFACTFITLCRLGGVPARWQSGLYVKPDSVGCHDWAMFYIEGLGWLWADCSFGSAARREGDDARRHFYFGNLGPWRMPANARFFAPLTPADPALRDDPFDNQMGELCVDGVGMTSYDREAEVTATMETL